MQYLLLQNKMKKINLRKLTTMAMMAACSIILVYFIRVAGVFPVAPFLEYDPADIPILIVTFMFGSVYGLVLTVIVSIIQAITVSAASGFIGALMHIFATGCYVICAGLIYKKFRTRKGAAAALIAGSLAMTVSMVVWNLIFTPIFMGVPLSGVLEIILPAIIPFNLMKAGINGFVTFILYKQVEKLIKI